MGFKLTEAEYRRMKDQDDGGYCLACGAVAYGIKPNARGYTCEDCEEPQVYGIEELMLMGKIYITDAGGVR